MDLRSWLTAAAEAIADWEAGFGPAGRHQSMHVGEDEFRDAFGQLTARLTARPGGNYPYFHPSYAGQMLKPPHPAAVAGYLAAMLINPNNHALDGGPATSELEKEAVSQLAAMFGLASHLGHLTSSGTIANLEALWVSRELHPGDGIAYSAQAHYTHGRMCDVLGVAGTVVPADDRGRIDVTELDRLLAAGRIGTVVATAGTTGLGAIDPVHDVLAVARRHGARVHVDAAYGGFFTLLAGQASTAGTASPASPASPASTASTASTASPARPARPGDSAEQDRAGLDPAPWRAIADCDSVVVDPHKHGLQPYGCGAVLFRDPAVSRLYRHDSPYTYFTSSELHLGEISLECSRAGAAAAALWLTFRLLPLTRDGLGRVLAAGRRAALDWSALLAASDRLELYQPPELDIVTYFPVTAARSLAAIDAASTRMLAAGMTSTDRPVFLSTLSEPAAAFARRHPDITADAAGARILRSVLMKPESEYYVRELNARVEALA